MLAQTDYCGPLVAGVVAVIPAYNEERFIGSVVLQARKYVDAVVVVDDGSADRTAEVAEFAGACVLRHARNRGKSAALNTALAALRQQPVRLAVFIDGDGQHFPEDIPSVAQPILAGEADVVVGSRFLQRKSQIPAWRTVGQHSLTLATNLLSGLPLTDSQSGFRAFSQAAMERMQFSQRGGFTVESEMQFLARGLHLRIVEVPIGVVYAEGPKRNPVKHGLQILNGLLGLVGQSRPLLFFGGGGVALMLVGLGFGWQTAVMFQQRHELAMGHALMMLLFAFVGVSSLFTGIMLHSTRSLFMRYISDNSPEPAPEPSATPNAVASAPAAAPTAASAQSRAPSKTAPRPAPALPAISVGVHPTPAGAQQTPLVAHHTPVGAKTNPPSSRAVAG